MQKRSLEICCYVAGAGAFGVFFRWLQTQIAFNDEGLADKSVLNLIVAAYIIAMAVVFIRMVDRLRNGRYFVPDEFSAALANPGKLFTGFRIFAGVLMAVGGVLLFATCETAREASFLRAVALLAMLTGITFPFVLGAANSDFFSIHMVCLCSVFPVILCAVWLITSYKTNDINSVLWAYSIEIIAISVNMIAFFRMMGFAFSAPNWPRAMFFAMMSCGVSILALADERNMGLQIIFAATALMMLIYVWIMIMNLQRFEAPPKEYPNDGFERL